MNTATATNFTTTTNTYTKDDGSTGTYDSTTFILPITLNKVTRDIEFWMHGNDRASAYGFAARIGCGTKAHSAMMEAWNRGDDVWEYRLNTTVLNRHATITQFRDEATESAKSRHNGSSIR
jgi:hypothetical protein